MSSTTASTTQPEEAQNTAIANVPQDAHPALEAQDDADSTLGTEYSDTTSITSSIYKGYIENGRRYQVVREGEYWGPSDEKQFESQKAQHITFLLLDSNEKNPLFRSPIPDNAQNILDLGTGDGEWAREVADRYPSALVQGVDLNPPPDSWVPPNCLFIVDDVLKPWMYVQKEKFDLIHMRDMLGSFTDEQWRLLYKQAYDNLAPGGWIEQVESSVNFSCDDDTLKPDGVLASWGPMFIKLLGKTGKGLDTIEHFKGRIEEAGFTNVQEKQYKIPLGEWTKNPVLREVGRINKAKVLGGIEGYAMFILTHFGEPQPWTPEEVQVHLAMVREELNAPGLHAYDKKKRIWAQKPLTMPAIGQA